MIKEYALELYKDMINDLEKIKKDVYYPSIADIDLNCYDDKRQRYEIVIKLTKHSVVTFDELKYLRDEWCLQNNEIEIDVDVVKEKLLEHSTLLTHRPYFKITVS